MVTSERSSCHICTLRFRIKLRKEIWWEYEKLRVVSIGIITEGYVCQNTFTLEIVKFYHFISGYQNNSTRNSSKPFNTLR